MIHDPAVVVQPLELDHVVCVVDDVDRAAADLEADGWLLDSGTVHAGEGTRNRRLLWPEQHLELLCVSDEREARASSLGFDRRANWRRSGASPFGLGFRGWLPQADRDDFWLHEEHGTRIWIHRDNERAPQRPLVFVVEVSGSGIERRRPIATHPELLAGWDGPRLQEVRVSAPSPCWLPIHRGPQVVQSSGPPRLELVLDASRRPLAITPILALRGLE